jgi:hypothetical protein
VRLILIPGVDEAPEQERALNALNALGCTYEGYNPRYFAIDIPPGVELSTVVDHLTRGEYEWEYVDPTYDEVHADAAATSKSPAS